MSSNSKISHHISSQVPFFVRNDHPVFVELIEKYYEFLEQNNETLDRIKNLPTIRDVDRADETYLQEIYDQFIRLLPATVVVDKKLLTKHVKDFYRARGTEKSVEFLINILLQKQANFYYPKRDILKTSDGKWFVEKSIRIRDITVDNVSNSYVNTIYNFENKRITGSSSNASAIVEKVDVYYDHGTLIYELKVSNQIMDFESGEYVHTIYEEDGDERYLSANIFSGVINSLTIDDGGTGYSVGDYASVESNTGSGGVVYVSGVTSGNILTATVLETGAGFRANQAISLTGGDGSGANLVVYTVNLDESIHPNTYNIVLSTIAHEANTNVGNNGIYESYAYQNLNVIYVNTSNLTINTGSGVTVSRVNLSGWIANSNVYFETFDSLNVNSVVYLITSTNVQSNVIFTSPGLPGNLVSNSFSVIKRANVNTPLVNALVSFVYGNTGPISGITVVSGGTNYTIIPTADVVSNTMIRALGILGRMRIVSGGTGYAVGDIIDIRNTSGGYGVGASANVTAVDANGTITAVRFKNVPGHITGGAGYDNEHLPYLNIISANGTGANVVAVTVLGDGEDILLHADEVGRITSITLASGGSDYIYSPTINLMAHGDGTAQVSATIVTGIYQYPGRFLNDDGFISGFNFLQNKNYYQNFSYVVRLNAPLKDYKQALLSLTHPAGTKLFGEFLYEDNQPSTNGASALTSTYRTVFLRGTYVTAANGSNSNVSVFVTSHGLSANANVYLEFLTGDTSNITNGLFMIRSSNTNYFYVGHANNSNTSGNVMAGIIV